MEDVSEESPEESQEKRTESPVEAPDRPYVGARVGLVVAAVLCASSLLVFAALARTVAAGGALPFDKPLMMWLYDLATPWLTALTEVVTEAGGTIAVPVVAVVVAAGLWWRGRRRDAVFLAVAVIGSTVLNVTLKAVFRRGRPDFWEHLVSETSYSFPSGHAMASMSVGTALVVLVWRATWSAEWQTLCRSVAAVVVVAYVVVVGVSRVYLGVHYPSDVLGGWCVAVVWVALAAALTGRQKADPVED